MPGWIVPLLAVIGAILVPFISAWVKKKSKPKEVHPHGGDQTVRDDISADIDAALGRMRPDDTGTDREAPDGPDARHRGDG